MSPEMSPREPLQKRERFSLHRTIVIIGTG